MKLEAGEIILQVGIEGGSITLLGIKTADWRFRMVTNESTFYDLLSEDDGAVECRPEDWIHESDWANSWGAALAQLDKYPWHQFYPLQVHHDFRQQVLEAVEKRFAKDQHGDEYGNFEQWCRLCARGDG